MNDSLYEQLKVLVVFFISGFLIGSLFDGFRAQRRALKISDFITYVQDILFWILSGIVVILTIVWYTDGQIRSYMIIGIVAGVVIYFNLFSKYILLAETKITIFIISAIKKLFAIFLYPIKKINKIIKKDWKKIHIVL